MCRLRRCVFYNCNFNITSAHKLKQFRYVCGNEAPLIRTNADMQFNACTHTHTNVLEIHSSMSLMGQSVQLIGLLFASTHAESPLKAISVLWSQQRTGIRSWPPDIQHSAGKAAVRAPRRRPSTAQHVLRMSTSPLPAWHLCWLCTVDKQQQRDHQSLAEINSPVARKQDPPRTHQRTEEAGWNLYVDADQALLGHGSWSWRRRWPSTVSQWTTGIRCLQHSDRKHVITGSGCPSALTR